MTKYAAIPTMFKGVQFRSRLEARWAAFFELGGLKWAYEPVDLVGYIPDFIVTFQSDGVERLVEVKPASRIKELAPACLKLDRSTWGGEAMIVGRDPHVIVCRVPEERTVVLKDQTLRVAGAWKWRGMRLTGGKDSWWTEAGNLTQYKSPRGR